MVVEAKVNKKCKKSSKAMEQLKDAKRKMQKLFDSIQKISSEWKYIGILYLKEGSFLDINCCKTCREFTIISQRDIFGKLENIEKKLKLKNWKPENHVKEFVELTKQIMFEAQG